MHLLCRVAFNFSVLLLALVAGCGEPQDRGVILGAAIPAAVVEDRLKRQEQLVPSSKAEEPDVPKAGRSSQIVFGDLHVHSTFSPDAFIMSIPMMGGS